MMNVLAFAMELGSMDFVYFFVSSFCRESQIL